MSLGSDSQVVEALQEGYNLERLLRALGCNTSKDNGSAFESGGGFIHCPMPDHVDANESCTVRAAQGQFYCQSLCGVILPMDLVAAHGHATDRGDAAKWIEQTLGLTPKKIVPQAPPCDDPSLTVAQYLAMRGLPDWIATKFQLEDVRVHQLGIDKRAKHVTFETGWYNAVLMPNRPGRRPRVRCSLPKSKIKWAAKARYRDDRMIDWNEDADGPGPAKLYPQDAIGVAHVEPAPTIADCPILLVVEGESDVHALHAMSLPFVVGVPGAKHAGRVRAELLEACLIAAGGDTDLSRLTVIVWQEPGSAGSQFPKSVARAITDAADEKAWRSPVFATLHHGAVEGKPKDPASMLSDLPPQMARQRMHDAIMACIPLATVASQVADTPRAAANSAQAALDVLQVDGEHTPPPETVVAASARPELPIVYDVAGNPVNVPSPVFSDSAPQRGGEAALWESFDELEESPERDLAPASVEGLAQTFYRSAEGWTVEKIDKDGDATYAPISSAFVVEQVERCSDEILVRVAAPLGGAWNRLRMPMAASADANATCRALATIGVFVVQRQKPAVTDLLQALARRREAEAGAVQVPSSTGWAGRPGTSDFGGIDVEPLNEMGARMYEANARRRKAHADTMAAARVWWEQAAAPLLAAPSGDPRASSAAPLLAIGAAAAAPLVGPLMEIGVSVAPVVWIAGLGGGGKSVLQKLAASIFSPSLPDLDGQAAYFASANMSQAALSARVDSCRDLPLELDDVTQLQPLPGSTSRGDAARIEAAASLGMMIFNRKPIERATREGGIRASKPFRSTAIFSAEVSMSSESSKAVITAGHRRRISTIEARPMTERGLGQAYAETVNDVSASVGGAPGELHVQGIRAVVAGRELRGKFEAIRRSIAAMLQSEGVTLTQRETLSVIVLGYAMLCEAIGEDYALRVEQALQTLGPYMSAGAGAGGATRDDELTGVEAALHSVDEVFGAHPHRFDRSIHDGADYSIVPPLQGYLGKRIGDRLDGKRRIVMLRTGMEMLSSRYGVTMQVIEQAQAEKRCKQGHQFRMSDGTRVRGTLWILPSATPDTDEPDIDPSMPAPHDTDPHGLAEPVGFPEAAEEKNMGLLTAVSSHRWQAPIAIEEYISSIAAVEAAKFVYESGRDAMLHAYSTGEGTRTINHQEGELNMDFRYAWGAGVYVVGDAEAMQANQSLHTTIRNDVAEELAALRGHYEAAALSDPQGALGALGALGAPIPVADFPEWEDPRWAKIDSLGPERARAQWKLHFEALYRANHAENAEGSRVAHEQHVKHQRIHLMCRYRHPEWFIVDEQGFA